MLNYSWKASPNRWGRSEFNTSFSIGFGNGLSFSARFQMYTLIWNRDRLYEIMDFGTYMYVLVCTEYIPVRNAENGTYMYVPVCTEFVQVL